MLRNWIPGVDPRQNRRPCGGSSDATPMPGVSLFSKTATLTGKRTLSVTVGEFAPLKPAEIRSAARRLLARRLETLQQHVQKSRKHPHTRFGLHGQSGRPVPIGSAANIGKVPNPNLGAEALARSVEIHDGSGLLTDLIG